MFWRGKTPVRKKSTQVLQGGCRREKIQKMSSLVHPGEELLQIFTPWCQSRLGKMLKFSTKCTNSCQNVQIPHIGKENVIIIPCRELLMRKKSKKNSSPGRPCKKNYLARGILARPFPTYPAKLCLRKKCRGLVSLKGCISAKVGSIPSCSLVVGEKDNSHCNSGYGRYNTS